MSDKAQGWLTVAAIILGLGLVGHIEEAKSREVVCMPTIKEVHPAEESRKVPVNLAF